MEGPTPDKDGWTSIHLAAENGHTEIVKILAPLTDNPNASNEAGITPIYLAAKNGHTEIVKILAPLTDNPNAPDKQGKTPIELAKNAEIREILETLETSRKLKAFLNSTDIFLSPSFNPFFT